MIGGDAVNDALAPPRKWSTSDQVETLAKGADVIVHSAIHPVMGPGLGSGMFPYAYYRQITVPDLGAMAQRAGAKHLMLTHLIPPIGAVQQYPFKQKARLLELRVQTEEGQLMKVETHIATTDAAIGVILAGLSSWPRLLVSPIGRRLDIGPTPQDRRGSPSAR